MLRCGRFSFDLARPLIMGIVNITPDSFSDGGKFVDAGAAIEHAKRLIDDGADIIDIGAESTRPGSLAVPIDEELLRLMPVLEELVPWNVPISVDTQKPEVMKRVIDTGADLINDVNGLLAPGAMEEIAAATSVAVCIMHKKGEPATMQQTPHYDDVVAEVSGFLFDQAARLEAMGVWPDRIVIDPGFGFGKSLEHNRTLLKHLDALCERGYPVLAGMSRKSMLGALAGKPVNERIAASVAAAIIAVQKGAKIVRVHDVRETRDALTVLQGVS